MSPFTFDKISICSREENITNAQDYVHRKWRDFHKDKDILLQSKEADGEVGVIMSMTTMMMGTIYDVDHTVDHTDDDDDGDDERMTVMPDGADWRVRLVDSSLRHALQPMPLHCTLYCVLPFNLCHFTVQFTAQFFSAFLHCTLQFIAQFCTALRSSLTSTLSCTVYCIALW